MTNREAKAVGAGLWHGIICGEADTERILWNACLEIINCTGMTASHAALMAEGAYLGAEEIAKLAKHAHENSVQRAAGIGF